MPRHSHRKPVSNPGASGGDTVEKLPRSLTSNRSSGTSIHVLPETQHGENILPRRRGSIHMQQRVIHIPRQPTEPRHSLADNPSSLPTRQRGRGKSNPQGPRSLTKLLLQNPSSPTDSPGSSLQGLRNTLNTTPVRNNSMNRETTDTDKIKPHSQHTGTNTNPLEAKPPPKTKPPPHSDTKSSQAHWLQSLPTPLLQFLVASRPRNRSRLCHQHRLNHISFLVASRLFFNNSSTALFALHFVSSCFLRPSRR